MRRDADARALLIHSGAYLRIFSNLPRPHSKSFKNKQKLINIIKPHPHTIELRQRRQKAQNHVLGVTKFHG
jgi:c-di-GMP-binding flagellar brake protein YcgR